MRIYYQMGENIILENAFDEIVDLMQLYFLEKMKYQIMWALRSIEHEMNNSEGRIIIRMDTINSGSKVKLEGFNKALLLKIAVLTHDIKF